MVGVVAAFALVIVSFVGGMILQWLFAPLPAGVDVPEVTEEAREAP
jgi:hypothetical protein